ncbi:pilus assembly protein TadG-related protein [Bacillus sp. 7884-1]|uniref:pilus assembly protein TadG-related protein n=1 Tax=Bacillus sp. 7884-1 TaxID=2021693 RepID=UPI000BA6F493|nr:Tad domain-containing protein [Bacillus sp. 7884-1]PAE44384.1 hypothetical protein CHI06_01725 [Bacillus sp. 7884-1]
MKKILKLLRLHDENGAVMVIVAAAMLGLIGFTALAVDGGRIYSEKSKLQKAVDSAVLAGAQGLLTNESSAREIASDIFYEEYGYDDSIVFNLTVEQGKSIKGEAVSIPVSMTFAKAIGTDVAHINASAKAIIAPLKSANGVAPIAIEQSQIPNATQLNCNNPGNNHGNCGYIRLGDDSGASDLADSIINGGSYLVDEPVDTEPGGMSGPVKDAIQTLIDNDADKLLCQSAATADNSCDRVITVVVIDTWEGCTGQCERNVVGLASYWIKEIKGNAIIGEFIKMVSPGEIGSGSGIGIGEYNLFGVKLDE